RALPSAVPSVTAVCDSGQRLRSASTLSVSASSYAPPRLASRCLSRRLFRRPCRRRRRRTSWAVPSRLALKVDVTVEEHQEPPDGEFEFDVVVGVSEGRVSVGRSRVIDTPRRPTQAAEVAKPVAKPILPCL